MSIGIGRSGSIVLGVGMVVLWIAGLNQGATMWVTWLVGIIALSSIVVAVMLPARPGRERARAPAAVGLGVLALGLIGVGTHATSWMAWWICAFGCAHLVVAALEARPSSHRLHHRAV